MNNPLNALRPQKGTAGGTYLTIDEPGGKRDRPAGFVERAVATAKQRKWALVSVAAVSAACFGCMAAGANYQTASSAAADEPLPPGGPAGSSFTWKSWFAIWCTLLSLIAMISRVPPEASLLAATMAMRLADVITHEEAWAGFRSTSTLSIAPLFVVAKGIEKAGTVQFVVKYVLGRPRNVREAIFRLCYPVTCVSGFVNDTPVVMMMMPIAAKWSKETGIALQKLLMPLSFAALLGGMCTLTGTATNLVLQGLVNDDQSLDPDSAFDLGFFTMTPAAAPTALICCLYLGLAGPWLLPDREETARVAEDEHAKKHDGVAAAAAAWPPAPSPLAAGEKRFAAEIRVTARTAGGTAADTGATAVAGATLLGVRRAGEAALLPAEAEPLAAGDILALSCTTRALIDLRHRNEIAGSQVVPLSPQYGALGAKRRRRRLYEVVLSPENVLVGTPTAEADALSAYGCAIFALRITPDLVSALAPPAGEPDAGLGPDRRAASLPKSIPEAARRRVIRPGDCLLVEAGSGFADEWRCSDAFASVAEVPGSEPPRFEKGKDRCRKVAAGCVLVSFVALVASDTLHVLDAAVAAAFVLVLSQCLSLNDAFDAIQLRLILAVVSCFGVGRGLEKTNVTRIVADGFVAVAKELYFLGDFGGSVMVLFFIFLVCASMSCIVSNQATVILLYPIVKDITDLQGVTLKMLVIILLMGASCSFMTPFGYQTNLMVMEPGGYVFTDYTKFGAPLTLLSGVCGAFFARVTL